MRLRNTSSVYIHIPFCTKICSYCDFCKVLYNEKMVDQYLDELECEIRKRYKGEVLKSIYIGGGTPSSLSLVQLNRLFNIIKIFNQDKDIEFTIECNFDSVNHEKIDLFKSVGINRISFGLESTLDKNLKFLNRSFNKNHVLDIISYLKRVGIFNINVDLIYALLDQDLIDLEKDLDFILSLDIKHVSLYSLMIEEHTMLFINKVKSISSDLDFKMYDFICKYLKNNGFNHYEISNFCKEGYSSFHNKVYWNNLYYYGFGVGASSYIDNKRSSNTLSITKYLSGSYLGEEEIISNDEVMDYEVMLNLRMIRGINKEKFYKKYSKNVFECYNYYDLVKDGLILEDSDNAFIPEDKLYVSNEIILRFLDSRREV